MTSYSYPNNPIIPPAQADQTGQLTNYGAAQPAYNRYLPGAQPDNQQWNQANAAYGQPTVAAAPQYQSYDQATAYNVNPAAAAAAAAVVAQPPQVPQYGYPSADNSFGSYGAGAGAGGGYQRKNDNFGQGNFRGNNSGNNRSGPGFNNKGPRSNYGVASGMEEQQDTIFVSGISEDTTEEQLKEHFGAIGLIKIDKKTRKPKIWVYKDKETGKPKGEVTITYDDYPTASSAISWFNGKELNGAVLKVELAQRKNNFFAGGGNQRGGNFGNRNRDFGDRNQRQGGGGGGAREGDWVCPGCQNNNFAWRNSCNRCKEEKPADAGDASGGRGGAGGLPYDRRGGSNQGGNRGPYNGPRNNRNGDQPGGFNRGVGGRDQRGGGGGGNRNGSFGGPMRNNSDNRRSGPY